LIEGISEGYKADESEKQATNELMRQKLLAIDLHKQRRQQLQQQQRLTYFQSSPAPLCTVDPSGPIERKKRQKEPHQQQQQQQDDASLQSLDRVIDSITVGMSRNAFNSRLKALARISFRNASTICNYIVAEQTEQNIKPSTAESKVKCLIWLSRYLDHKPFEGMTKQDIVSYLSSIRKPVSVDPNQRWIGSYNGRLRYYLKFFRWLFNMDEPDYRKHTNMTGSC
jgi:hypothetical protein